MPNDQIFRWMMVAVFAVIFPFVAYYRFQSQKGGGSLDRKQEGWFLLLGIRISGLVYGGSVIVFLVNPANLAWSSVMLPDWLRWIGIGLGVLAGVLWVTTFHYLGKNLTDTVVTRENHTLITGGPYRIVRHPFYLVVGLLAFANGLAMANWFIFIFGAFLWTLLIVRTDREEARLIGRFGDEYRRYMEKTGKFFPKF